MRVIYEALPSYISEFSPLILPNFFLVILRKTILDVFIFKMLVGYNLFILIFNNKCRSNKKYLTYHKLICSNLLNYKIKHKYTRCIILNYGGTRFQSIFGHFSSFQHENLYDLSYCLQIWNGIWKENNLKLVLLRTDDTDYHTVVISNIKVSYLNNIMNSSIYHKWKFCLANRIIFIKYLYSVVFFIIKLVTLHINIGFKTEQTKQLQI